MAAQHWGKCRHKLMRVRSPIFLRSAGRISLVLVLCAQLVIVLSPCILPVAAAAAFGAEATRDCPMQGKASPNICLDNCLQDDRSAGHYPAAPPPYSGAVFAVMPITMQAAGGYVSYLPTGTRNTAPPASILFCSFQT